MIVDGHFCKVPVNLHFKFATRLYAVHVKECLNYLDLIFGSGIFWLPNCKVCVIPMNGNPHFGVKNKS